MSADATPTNSLAGQMDAGARADTRAVNLDLLELPAQTDHDAAKPVVRKENVRSPAQDEEGRVVGGAPGLDRAQLGERSANLILSHRQARFPRGTSAG